MKHKHILLTTAVAIILSGCGRTPELTPQEKAVLLKRNEAHMQKAKEDYLFSSFERTEGAHQYSNIDYTIVDESMQKPSSKEWGRENGCLKVPSSSWKFDSNIPPELFSLKWPCYKERGYYSSSYLRTANDVVGRLKKKGFEVGFLTGMLSENYNFSVWGHDRLSMTIPQQSPLDFHTLLTSMLLRDTVPSSDLHHYLVSLGYVRTLIGVKYQNKALTLIEEGDQNTPKLVLADEFRKRDYYHHFPSKIASDTPVTQAQIDEWNQVFIDALKKDPFFGKQMTTPTDASGSTSALAALKGQSGVDATQLMVNGVSGSQVDLGLPMVVQLKGSVDQGKSTSGMTGLVAHKLGNSVLGVIQSYANSGTGFNTDSRQLESSVIAAHSFGLMFVEGQFGSVSATDVNFKDWSGIRSQVRLGIDTPFGAPFIQLTHRDFGHTSDTAAYVGFEIATTEFKADIYAFSTSLLTKVGHHSVHGATGSIDWTAALTLNSGVAFNTNLTLGSALESKAAFNLSLDR